MEILKQEIEKLEEYDVWDQPENIIIIIIFCHSSPSNTLFHLFWVVYLSKIQFNPVTSYGN